MKAFHWILAPSLLCLFMASHAQAALVTGVVQCDSNQNGTNDPSDQSIASVLVVITNQSGTFSNATFTAANGSFSLQIPNFDSLAERRDPLSQIYVETLDANTLPQNSSILFPLPVTFISSTPAQYVTFAPEDLTNLVFNSGSGSFSTGNWLLNCPSDTCGVAGAGTIRGQSRRPEHTFSGNVAPASAPNGTRRGHWTHVALAARLLFQSSVVQTVTCGTVSGPPSSSNSAINMIEFSGLGTLRGIGGNRVRSSQVYFTIRVEDHGQPSQGLDRYYLRVHQADGTTLLLVSGDPSNPQDIVTVPISSGNFRIRPGG